VQANHRHCSRAYVRVQADNSTCKKVHTPRLYMSISLKGRARIYTLPVRSTALGDCFDTGHGAGLVGVFTEFDAEAGTLTEPALLASYTGSSFSLTANGKAGGGIISQSSQS
jgi:hypothetical protein